MMFDESGCCAVLLVLAAVGALAGFCLWAFRVIPAWGIAAGGVGLPLALLILLVISSFLGSRR